MQCNSDNICVICFCASVIFITSLSINGNTNNTMRILCHIEFILQNGCSCPGNCVWTFSYLVGFGVLRVNSKCFSTCTSVHGIRLPQMQKIGIWCCINIYTFEIIQHSLTDFCQGFQGYNLLKIQFHCHGLGIKH